MYQVVLAIVHAGRTKAVSALIEDGALTPVAQPLHPQPLNSLAPPRPEHEGFLHLAVDAPRESLLGYWVGRFY